MFILTSLKKHRYSKRKMLNDHSKHQYYGKDSVEAWSALPSLKAQWPCIAAVTDYHKLSASEQDEFIILSSEVLKLMYWQSCLPYRGSRWESVFLPFPASPGCLHSWAHGLQHTILSSLASASVFISPLFYSDFPESLFQGPLWVHQVHPDNPAKPLHFKVLNLN